MILSDFYTAELRFQEEQVYFFDVHIHPDHSLFAGHFPQHKVVPGVCQLEIIRQCAERISGHLLRMPSISQVKFLQMIDPDRVRGIQLRLQLESAAEGLIQAEAQLQSGEGVFLKFKGIFQPDAQFTTTV